MQLAKPFPDSVMSNKQLFPVYKWSFFRVDGDVTFLVFKKNNATKLSWHILAGIVT